MIAAQLFFPFMSDPISLGAAAPRRRTRRPRRPSFTKPVQLCLPLTFASAAKKRVSPWRARLAAAWRWLVGLLAFGGAAQVFAVPHLG